MLLMFRYSNGRVARLFGTVVVDPPTSICTPCSLDYVSGEEGTAQCRPCNKARRQTTLGRTGQSLCVIENPMTVSLSLSSIYPASAFTLASFFKASSTLS